MRPIRITTTVVLMSAALVATGCGNDKPDPHSSAAIHKAAAETVFAQAAANADPDDLQGVPAKVIAPEGHHVCSMLQSGQTVADAIAYLRLGFSSKETGALIGAAPALCPEQQAKITAGLNSLG